MPLFVVEDFVGNIQRINYLSMRSSILGRKQLLDFRMNFLPGFSQVLFKSNTVNPDTLFGNFGINRRLEVDIRSTRYGPDDYTIALLKIFIDFFKRIPANSLPECV